MELKESAKVAALPFLDATKVIMKSNNVNTNFLFHIFLAYRFLCQFVIVSNLTHCPNIRDCCGLNFPGHFLL